MDNQNQLLLDKLTAAYDNTHLFEAEFIQTKQVKFMQKPLVSSGRIKFAKGHGLLWVISKPFQSKTWVNEQGVFKSNQFEQKKPVNDPQMKAVAGVLAELLSSKVDKVAEKFTVSNRSSEDKTAWHVVLIPNTILLKKVLQSIEVIGIESDVGAVKGIQRIVVTDNNQNITGIEFSDIQIQYKPLTEQQISEF